jgi:hypothetical protein
MKQFKFFTTGTRPLPEFVEGISELGLLRTSNMIDNLSENNTQYRNGEDIYKLFGELLENRRLLRFDGDVDSHWYRRVITLPTNVVINLNINTTLDIDYFNDQFNSWYRNRFFEINNQPITWEDKLMGIIATLEHYFMYVRIYSIEIEGQFVPNPFQISYETV